ncbi:LacI family DNA-binding transcriptional regulator [Cytobacillus gottheilii]|uniref:LacI family DNA-binding transcriptional regulator n=1 Tax=Cytobacillus gottheilii TaxID=859144 RepID=A0ABX8FEX4_9BACI|nr:LacI family DNA-binding transcriptional regulator [Cytobacillus gottheilii]QVY62576.1 LacI family DNA-binding transcriptional regulator [Cytobacillus gottheilii]
MNKKPTIRDVAKQAGVSPATVSYVLNDVKKVSDKTKTVVLEAIEQLNYYPDFTAVSLSKKKSNLIGIMLPIIEDSPASVFKNNLYYNEFVSGVELVARNRKFDTMITGVGDLDECKNWIMKRNIDGLIILGMFPESLYNELKSINIPIALIDTYEDYTNLFNNVKVNDKYGGYLAAKHLIELGHRNIAFVATNLLMSPVDRKRYQGFEQALKEAGIQPSKDLIFETLDITFEDGAKVGQELLSSNQEITGIVTVSDVLAIGMIKAIQQEGKQVPADYSIVGFDDLSICKYITPSLTTIRQDIFEKGKLAADQLVNAIESLNSEQKTIEMPVELIVRESTRSL